MTESSTPEVRRHTEWVAAWQRSETLDALRSLLSTSERTKPALARRTKLSHTELSVLEHVLEHQAGPSELADRLGVTTAAASGIVDRLATYGHVQREPHASDRRRTIVAPTDSGREEVLGHLMPMFRELAKIDEDMTPEERAIVVRFLRQAEQAIERLL